MSKSSQQNDRLSALRVNVPCMFACPSETNIPEYIGALSRGDYDLAYRLNRARNLFPGSLGRVCTRPCEPVCRHGYENLGEPVSICRLKRVAGDFHKTAGAGIPKKKKTGKQVAVIGAGPAGLAAARDLLLLGHEVSIYESSEKLGGMLSISIPEFRLPRNVIDEDIEPILKLGPRIYPGKTLGVDMSLDDLTGHYDAVLLAVGCQRSREMKIPGESLEGVFHGLPFLVDVANNKKPRVGRSALVIGGGYTAVDCARVLVRMGVEKISVAYRRTEDDVSIEPEELEHLKIEDVQMRYLTTATEFIPEKNGRLGRVELTRTGVTNGKVGLIRGSQRVEDFDSAIICIGQTADADNFIGKHSSLFDSGRLKIDENTLMSERNGLFGAGDYVFGTRSIIDAIGDGRRAALGIHAFLKKEKVPEKTVSLHVSRHPGRSRADDFIPRVEERSGIGKAVPGLKKEVNYGYNEAENAVESKRCYQCNLHYEINLENCIYCLRCIDEAPVDCIKMVKDLGDWGPRGRAYKETAVWDEIGIIYIDNDKCVRCNKCLDVCPTRCISVSKHTLVDPIFGEKS